ncbi:unnamed protein product [Paramecium octaurelia]|uniref:Tetratricopeptide repeat protein n=1 Tax=Paramecium octaurelia TaxID=43137 RepID=A0A8S1V771_PAROT|nr:unnamed protein product [Paramecium octaurelia]
MEQCRCQSEDSENFDYIGFCDNEECERFYCEQCQGDHAAHPEDVLVGQELEEYMEYVTSPEYEKEIEQQELAQEFTEFYERIIKENEEETKMFYLIIQYLKDGNADELVKLLDKIKQTKVEFDNNKPMQISKQMDEYRKRIRALDEKFPTGDVQKRQKKIELMNKGRQLFKQQEYFEALENLQQAIGIDNDYVEAILIKAQTQIQLENYDEAITGCDYVIQIDRLNGEAYYLKIIALLLSQKYDVINEALRVAYRKISYKFTFNTLNLINQLEKQSPAVQQHLSQLNYDFKHSLFSLINYEQITAQISQQYLTQFVAIIRLADQEEINRTLFQYNQNFEVVEEYQKQYDVDIRPKLDEKEWKKMVEWLENYKKNQEQQQAQAALTQGDDQQGGNQQGENQQGENQQRDDQQGDNQQRENQQRENQQRDDQQGDNQQGENQQRENQQRDDQQGDNQQRENQQRENQQRDDQQGDNQQRENQQRENQQRDDQQGDNQQRENQQRENQQRDDQQGDNQQRENQQRENQQRDDQQGDNQQRENQQRENQQRDDQQGDNQQRENQQRENQQRDDQQGDNQQRENQQRENQQRDDQQGDNQQRENQQRENQQRDDQQGDNQQRENQQRENQQRDDQQGDNQQRENQQRENQQRDDQQGDNQQGENQQRENQQRDDQQGDNQQGENQQRENQQGDNQQGDSQQGKNQQGGNQQGDQNKNQQSDQQSKDQLQTQSASVTQVSNTDGNESSRVQSEINNFYSDSQSVSVTQSEQQESIVKPQGGSITEQPSSQIVDQFNNFLQDASTIQEQPRAQGQAPLTQNPHQDTNQLNKDFQGFLSDGKPDQETPNEQQQIENPEKEKAKIIPTPKPEQQLSDFYKEDSQDQNNQPNERAQQAAVAQEVTPQVQKDLQNFLSGQEQYQQQQQQEQDITTLDETKRLLQVLKYCDQTIKKGNAAHQFYFKKAMTLKQLNDFDNAMDNLDIAIEKNDNQASQANYYYQKALLLIRLDALDLALNNFDEAISRNPNEIQYYKEKGNVLIKQDRLNEAEDCFQQAKQITEAIK